EQVIRALADQFGRRVVVLTLGAQGAMALDKGAGALMHEPAYIVPSVVDRVGAGDAFAAGFIAGYMEDGCQRGLKLGNALAAVKMSIPGDMALVTRHDVDALVSGGDSAIRR